jgi:hypothetical protein
MSQNRLPLNVAIATLSYERFSLTAQCRNTTVNVTISKFMYKHWYHVNIKVLEVNWGPAFSQIDKDLL